MPSYAVLGATGSTGQSLIRVLLQTPANEVHAYCRSKEKLVKSLPEVANNENVRIFDGRLDDIDLLASCIRGTRAVFLAVAVNDNIPACSIAMDTARVVITVLERLKSEDTKLPKLVVLSSASLEPKLMSETPRFVHSVALTAFSNIYADLRVAEELLRSKEPLVSTIFVKPGALCHDAQKGHVLSLKFANSPLSFMDLAAGMVEAVESSSGQYDMKNVAVNATAKDVAFPREAPLAILRGLLFHFFPWTYQYLG